MLVEEQCKQCLLRCRGGVPTVFLNIIPNIYIIDNECESLSCSALLLKPAHEIVGVNASISVARRSS